MLETAAWGVPNGLNASDYPQPEDLHPIQWWWEFLRRREDYRERWLTHEGACRCERRDWCRLQDFEDFHEFDRMIRERRERRPDWPSECIYSQIDFAICHLLDPRHSRSAADLVGNIKIPGGQILGETESGLVERLRGGKVIWEFDTSWPIAPQLERVRRHLQHYSDTLPGRMSGASDPPKFRHRAERWPKLLRVLDARDAGRKLAEIGTQICGCVEGDPAGRAQDDIEVAIDLGNKGPRYFLR